MRKRITVIVIVIVVMQMAVFNAASAATIKRGIGARLGGISAFLNEMYMRKIRNAHDVYVGGYYKKNRTYVQPYYRSKPNNNVKDNYSYKGNINPYTGQIGSNCYKDNPTSEYYGTSSK